MGQITQEFVEQMFRDCDHGKHPPLTVWEAEQLARAWIERELLRHELDIAKRRADRAMSLLNGIHALMYPAPIKTDDGRLMVFRPKDPDPHVVLQELSDRIRALPEEMANQSGPREFGNEFGNTPNSETAKRR